MALLSPYDQAQPRIAEDPLLSKGDLLFKEQLQHALHVALLGLVGSKHAQQATIELSENPDFGDYFSTAALRLSQAVATEPRRLSEDLAKDLSRVPIVAKAEASGQGFLNIFVHTSAAAQALARLSRWIDLIAPSQSRPERPFASVHRLCLDHKRKFVLKTLELLNRCLEELPPDSTQAEEVSRLELLNEPEEFRVILQLHEFPSQFRGGITCGYLYRLSTLIHDGLFENGTLPDYWLKDWEEPAKIQPRCYLLKLCLRVLSLGANRVLPAATHSQ